jgi:VanZ family protein
LVLSTILLTLPGSSFPKEDWLSKIWFDKWVHAGMFFLLVLLWCRPFASGHSSWNVKRRVFILVAFTGLAYGIAMEFVQLHLIRNRSFDWGDIAADAIGSAIGLWFSTGRYIKK